MPYGPVFLSQELAYLYQHSYIQHISQLLSFPIAFNAEIFAENANKKYLQPVEHNWLDVHIRAASRQ